MQYSIYLKGLVCKNEALMELLKVKIMTYKIASISPLDSKGTSLVLTIWDRIIQPYLTTQQNITFAALLQISKLLDKILFPCIDE